MLDDAIGGGFRAGTLNLLGGPQGQGKTMFAMQAARAAAKQGRSAVFFSYELEADALTQRLVAMEGGELDPYEAPTLSQVRSIFEGTDGGDGGLIERFAVKSVTWVHSIPMPVPHTRPIGVTVSGNRRELIETMSIWKPQTQVPANALHLLEYRLQQLSYPIAGFVLLVPHYLADTEYPAAAIAGLDSISAASPGSASRAKAARLSKRAPGRRPSASRERASITSGTS